MGRMSAAMLELEALRGATRVRLNASTVKRLREWQEAFDGTDDHKSAHGLAVLLDMHDKLEAIRNGS